MASAEPIPTPDLVTSDRADTLNPPLLRTSRLGQSMRVLGGPACCPKPRSVAACVPAGARRQLAAAPGRSARCSKAASPAQHVGRGRRFRCCSVLRTAASDRRSASSPTAHDLDELASFRLVGELTPGATRILGLVGRPSHQACRLPGPPPSVDRARGEGEKSLAPRVWG